MGGGVLNSHTIVMKAMDDRQCEDMYLTLSHLLPEEAAALFSHEDLTKLISARFESLLALEAATEGLLLAAGLPPGLAAIILSNGHTAQAQAQAQTQAQAKLAPAPSAAPMLGAIGGKQVKQSLFRRVISSIITWLIVFMVGMYFIGFPATYVGLFVKGMSSTVQWTLYNNEYRFALVMKAVVDSVKWPFDMLLVSVIFKHIATDRHNLADAISKFWQADYGFMTGKQATMGRSPTISRGARSEHFAKGSAYARAQTLPSSIHQLHRSFSVIEQVGLARISMP